jgi:hypothetical protein
MSALSTYILQCRRLLHDASAQFWSDSELTDYINSARNRTVRDTGAYRLNQALTFTTGVEIYSLANLPVPAIDCLGISYIFGNSRLAMSALAWSEFQAKYRYWTNMIGRPEVFAVYNYQSIYIWRLPDQNYTAEVDTVCLPAALVDNTSLEVIPAPFIEPIPYYACHLAKIKEQSYGEADKFMEVYKAQALAALTSTLTRRAKYPYA